jgi:uncharacterized membrane protein
VKSKRAQVLEWAEQGALPAANVAQALAVAGVTPDGDRWHRFVGALFLWLGALLFAAGTIFFFAYNWDAMGRMAKFGLAEALLVAAVSAALTARPGSTAGQASLLGAALLTGALLALVGQTYQTGADPYELFLYWALVILPWVLVAKAPALWLLLVALLNLAVALYFTAFGTVFGFLSSGAALAWLLLALNTAALAAWEFAAFNGVAWLRERWAVRILGAASGSAVTVLADWAVFDSRDVGALAFPVYGAWLALAYWFYRYKVRDLFMLAGSILSVIVFVTTALGDVMLSEVEAFGFLFIALVVIGMAAAGAWWLRQIAAEDEAA